MAILAKLDVGAPATSHSRVYGGAHARIDVDAAAIAERSERPTGRD